MLNVRLAGDHLCGQLLFTWLSLVMSMMVSFYAVLFPRNVLDEIWNLIKSVSEGFPVYSHSFYGSVRRIFFFFFFFFFFLESWTTLPNILHTCITIF